MIRKNNLFPKKNLIIWFVILLNNHKKNINLKRNKIFVWDKSKMKYWSILITNINSNSLVINV